jgi:hypothetical protein
MDWSKPPGGDDGFSGSYYTSSLLDYLVLLAQRPAVRRMALLCLFVFVAYAYVASQHRRRPPVNRRTRRTGNNRGSGAPSSSSFSSPSSVGASSRPKVRIDCPYDRYCVSHPGAAASTVCLSASLLINEETLEPHNTEASNADLQWVQMMATHSDLYVVAHLRGLQEGKREEGEEQAVVAKLTQAVADLGLFANGLKKHQLLPCTTYQGKKAIFRHISAALCIDTDSAQLKALVKYVPIALCVARSDLSTSSSSSSASLSSPTPSSSTPALEPQVAVHSALDRFLEPTKSKSWQLQFNTSKTQGNVNTKKDD